MMLSVVVKTGSAQMDAKLFDRDWRFITDSLYYLYGASTLDEFEKEALDRLSMVIPSDHYMFTIIHEHPNAPTTFSDVVCIGEPARYLDEFLSGKYDFDPYFKFWSSFKNTKVFRDTDMMPDSYRVSTPLYKDIYIKQGIHYAMRISIVSEGRALGNISLFRKRGQSDFSDHDIEIARVFAPHLTQKLDSLLNPTLSKGLAIGKIEAFDKFGLTPKEREVVQLVLDDLTDGEIADTLCISRATLKTHIYNIYRKTGVKNRLQLIALAKAE